MAYLSSGTHTCTAWPITAVVRQEGAQGTHTCTAWPITAVFLGFESGGCSGNSHMHSRMTYYSGVSRIMSQEGAQGTHICTAWPVTAAFLGFVLR